MRLGKRTVGQASLTLGSSEALPKHLQGVIEVSEVFTPEGYRKQNHADQLLSLITWEADNYGIVLMLMPEGDEWLEQWYEKHGFKRIQDEPVLMARKPNDTNTH